MLPPALNLETRRGLLIVSGLLSLMLWAGYACELHWHGGWLFDGGPLVVGRDFANFWMAGRKAWAPDGHWYDFRDHTAQLRAFLGPDYAYQQWSYPPSLMLVMAPFGLLPYAAALTIWYGLQAGLLLWLARRYGKESVLLLLASPAMLAMLVSGQASLFFLALLLVIFEWRERYPAKAGLLTGLFGIKPQLVLLLPVALLAERRWRMIAVAAVSTLGVASLVVALWGPEPWMAYLMRGIPEQSTVAINPPRNIAALMPTFFVELHALKLPNWLCNLGQGLLSLAAAFFVWDMFRRKSETPDGKGVGALRFALFAAASVMASAYWMSYDLLILTWGAIRLLQHVPLDGRGRLLTLGLYFLPALCLVIHSFALPGIPLVLLAFAFWARARLRALPEAEGAPATV